MNLPDGVDLHALLNELHRRRSNLLQDQSFTHEQRELIQDYSHIVQETLLALRQQLNLDDLTAVGNRKFFLNALNKHINNIANHEDYQHDDVVVFIDVDNFKTYNDIYGQVSGDHMLRSVAQYLKRSFRTDSSDILARIGGDEFAILMRRVTSDPNNLRMILDEVISSYRDDDEISCLDPDLATAISIGTAFVDPKYTSEEHIEHSNQANKHSKFLAKIKKPRTTIWTPNRNYDAIVRIYDKKYGRNG